MSWLFNPDDWFGRHPRVCLGLVFLLILLASAI
jgi:hypothetical protein